MNSNDMQSEQILAPELTLFQKVALAFLRWFGVSGYVGEDDGYGVLVYASGAELAGYFKHGEVHGRATLTTVDGFAIEGNYCSGERDRIFTIRQSDSRKLIMQITYENGKLMCYSFYDKPSSQMEDFKEDTDLGSFIYGSHFPMTHNGLDNNGYGDIVEEHTKYLLRQLNKETRPYPIDFKYTDVGSFFPHFSDKAITVLSIGLERHQTMLVINPFRKIAYFIDNNSINHLDSMAGFEHIKKHLNALDITVKDIHNAVSDGTIIDWMRSGPCVNHADANIVMFSVYFCRALRKSEEWQQLQTQEDDATMRSVVFSLKSIEDAFCTAVRQISKPRTIEQQARTMWFMPQLELVNAAKGQRLGYNSYPIGHFVYKDWPQNHVTTKSLNKSNSIRNKGPQVAGVEKNKKQLSIGIHTSAIKKSASVEIQKMAFKAHDDGYIEELRKNRRLALRLEHASKEY